jgi:hypothetical protein
LQGYNYAFQAMSIATVSFIQNCSSKKRLNAQNSQVRNAIGTFDTVGRRNTHGLSSGSRLKRGADGDLAPICFFRLPLSPKSLSSEECLKMTKAIVG